MRRNRRLTIIRIGLAMATLAMVLPVAAQAKPSFEGSHPGGVPGQGGPGGRHEAASQGSHPGGVPGQGGPGDRHAARRDPVSQPWRGPDEAQLGIVSSRTPDDRGFARTYDEQPVLVSDGGSSFDVNQYAVTGFGLALVLMAGGLGLAIRHNRRSRLSPA